MNEHKYILEPYYGMSSRYTCPQCGNAKEFTRYINIITEAYLADYVGKCNREIKCGYHYTPKRYFGDNRFTIKSPQRSINIYNKSVIESTSFVSLEIFKCSLGGYAQNNLVNYLIKLFGVTIATGLIEKYYIGTSEQWNGATIFWQIDILGRIRTGKAIQCNSENGKRDRKTYNHIKWIHKSYNLKNFKLKQCFFGEHLLTDKRKKVAIVESEKTAIIASVYLPQFIWLATGGINNLNEEKFNVLSNRDVVLFPDLGAYEAWNLRIHKLSKIANIKICDLLEQHATEEEKKQGLDLADFLPNYDYS